MTTTKIGRKLACGVGAALWSGMGALLLSAGGAGAQELGPLTRMTGASPFSGCTADRVAQQDGTVYRNTEIEPWVDANPLDPRNLIAGWQQDRWDNGGARGDVAGVSKDDGASWRIVTLPGASVCTGGRYLRNSDPWISFSPNGVAFYMVLAFDPDRPSGSFGPNAMLVSRSTNGGLSWGRPTALIRDGAGQVLNDKNSITADPTDRRYVHAVWDRLEDFTLPPAARADVGVAAVARDRSLGMDGLAITRERVRKLQAQAKNAMAGATGASSGPLLFKGPTYLPRTADGGWSWERARVIYDPGNNRQTIGNIVDVLPNGTVIDFFVDILQNGALLRSTNKGLTFERRPTYITTVNNSDTGVITPDELEPVRDAAILFSVAVNRETGSIYIVWQDIRFRGVDEVAFSQSDDGGATWPTPIRVNQIPPSPNPLRQQAFVPSVEVSARRPTTGPSTARKTATGVTSPIGGSSFGLVLAKPPYQGPPPSAFVRNNQYVILVCMLRFRVPRPAEGQSTDPDHSSDRWHPIALDDMEHVISRSKYIAVGT